CFGYWKDIDDASITGEPITNENGEVYYWTTPNEGDSGSDIPYQGANGAMMYDSNGNRVYVEQKADGYWYDENGV
ncbi:hypothetical protein RFZ44_05565, partial [Acinetobacter sp. 163]|nr:hypothetical protein [Acinetobacter sp. 163]